MPNYSGLIDNKQLLDFSQNFGVTRNYLGSRLFPDQKTEYIKQEYSRLVANGNLPQMAQVHAFDTEAAIASRVPFEKVSLEELLIKEKINLTENLRRLTNGMSMNMDSIRRYAFDDVARMAETVVTRAEKAKMDVLANGALTIKENGLDFTIDYGMPSENKVTADWSKADADILGEIEEWRQLAVANGVSPTMIVTTDAIMLKIKKNQGVQKAVFGSAYEGSMPSNEDIRNLFQSMYGIDTIEINEAKYGVLGAKNASTGLPTIKQERFFPAGKFVLTAAGDNGTVGAGLWGVTPEEDAQGGVFDSKRQEQFVTCVTWETPDPVTQWTKASGLFVPVHLNVYGTVIADVTTDANSSSTEG